VPLPLHGCNLDFSARFDTQSLCVFVGDYAGQITVLKISRTSFEMLTVLKGHTGIAASCLTTSVSYLVFLHRTTNFMFFINTSFESDKI